MTNVSNLDMFFEAVDEAVRAHEAEKVHAFRETFHDPSNRPIGGGEFLPWGPFCEEVKLPLPSVVKAVAKNSFKGQLLYSEQNSEEFKQVKYSSQQMVKAIKRWMDGFRLHCTSDEQLCKIIGINVDDYKAWYNAEIAMGYRWKTTYYLRTRIQEEMDKQYKARYNAALDARPRGRERGQSENNMFLFL